jgi:hypothetical protein
VRTLDGALSNTLPLTIGAVPVLTSLAPPSTVSGGPQLPLAATGANFVSGTVLTWNGTPLGTNVTNAGQLIGFVTPNLIAAPGVATVGVLSPDGVASNTLPFNVVGLLTIVPTVLPQGTTSSPYLAQLVANGGLAPYTWNATGLPPGLLLNSVTGALVGTPTAAGNFTVFVTVTDAAGGSANASLPVTVVLSTGPLQITAATLPTGVVDQNYTGPIGAIGGVPPLTFSVSAGSLPPGLLLGTDGFIGGKPTTTGHFTFTVRVTDSVGTQASAPFAIDVVAPPLNITTTSPLPPSAVGTGINVSFAATGGVPPYSFTASGSLPPGTQVTNGALTGTPTEAGTFTFSVTAKDSTNLTTSKSFTIVISPPDLLITTASQLPAGSVGNGYSAQFAATGGVQPYTFGGAGLPDGLSMSAAGLLSGTPTVDGQFNVTVTVVDSANARVTKQFSLTINPPALSVTSSALPSGSLGAAYTASVAATGGVKPYSFSFAGLPAGLVGAPNGAIGGTPTAVGDFAVTVTVTDAKNTTATATPHITIVAQTLVINTSSLPNGVLGTAYSATLSASGGVAPLSFSVTGLPPGLLLGGGGAISGTPTAAGTTTVNVTATDSTGASVSKSFQVTVTLPPAPPATITGAGGNSNPGTQRQVGITITNPFPIDMVVTLTLTFAPDSGPDDPSIQFATGGRTTTLTIPAGQTLSLSNVGVQVGTVAGLITINAKLAAAGADVTPNPAPSATIRINATAPVLTGITATRTASGFTVVVTGFASSKQITSAIVTFTAAPGANLQTTTLTVPVDSLFTSWFSNAASGPFGGQFTLTLPFNVQGDVSAIVSVTVTLVSNAGNSTPLTANVQ